VLGLGHLCTVIHAAAPDPVPSAQLAERLRARLAALADPVRAPQMQRYMKSAMPYLGVATVPRRVVCKAVFAGLSWPDGMAWAADVHALWRDAVYREERYCAIELTGLRAARRFQTMAVLSLYEEMIVTGAWWDYVDELASRRLWDILRAEPVPMKAAMRDWAHCDDMWKRRSAILCQIRSKAKTDRALLADCIAPSLASKEFFLRKAIGWALRSFAHTDPAWVRAYVADQAARLSGLSKREALKHIG
jgi:3-methyladenine DNA glycosylase AlkD